MQSTLWPILMTMLIWNDLMNSQHDNLSRGSPRLMTSDRQILYPHIPLAVTPLVALRLRRSRSSSSSPSRRRRCLPLVGVDVGEFCLTFEFCLTLIAFEFPWVYWLISLPLCPWVEFTPVSTLPLNPITLFSTPYSRGIRRCRMVRTKSSVHPVVVFPEPTPVSYTHLTLPTKA